MGGAVPEPISPSARGAMDRGEKWRPVMIRSALSLDLTRSMFLVKGLKQGLIQDFRKGKGGSG